MRKFMLAAAVTAFATGAAVAQEAPYNVRHGQVKYPGQMQWNALYGDGYAMAYDVDPYYGGAAIALPGPTVYAPSIVPSYGGPGDMVGAGLYDEGPRYNQHGPGAYIFDGEVVNSDQNYSGR